MCLALPLLLIMSANGHCFTIASHFLQLFIGPRAAMYWAECSRVLDLGLPHVGNNLFRVQSVKECYPIIFICFKVNIKAAPYSHIVRQKLKLLMSIRGPVTKPPRCGPLFE